MAQMPFRVKIALLMIISLTEAAPVLETSIQTGVQQDGLSKLVSTKNELIDGNIAKLMEKKTSSVPSFFKLRGYKIASSDSDKTNVMKILFPNKQLKDQMSKSTSEQFTQTTPSDFDLKHKIKMGDYVELKDVLLVNDPSNLDIDVNNEINDSDEVTTIASWNDSDEVTNKNAQNNVAATKVLMTRQVQSDKISDDVSTDSTVNVQTESTVRTQTDILESRVNETEKVHIHTTTGEPMIIDSPLKIDENAEKDEIVGSTNDAVTDEKREENSPVEIETSKSDEKSSNVETQVAETQSSADETDSNLRNSNDAATEVSPSSESEPKEEMVGMALNKVAPVEEQTVDDADKPIENQADERVEQSRVESTTTEISRSSDNDAKEELVGIALSEPDSVQEQANDDADKPTENQADEKAEQQRSESNKNPVNAPNQSESEPKEETVGMALNKVAPVEEQADDDADKKTQSENQVDEKNEQPREEPAAAQVNPPSESEAKEEVVGSALNEPAPNEERADEGSDKPTQNENQTDEKNAQPSSDDSQNVNVSSQNLDKNVEESVTEKPGESEDQKDQPKSFDAVDEAARNEQNSETTKQETEQSSASQTENIDSEKPKDEIVESSSNSKPSDTVSENNKEPTVNEDATTTPEVVKVEAEKSESITEKQTKDEEATKDEASVVVASDQNITTESPNTTEVTTEVNVNKHKVVPVPAIKVPGAASTDTTTETIKTPEPPKPKRKGLKPKAKPKPSTESPLMDSFPLAARPAAPHPLLARILLTAQKPFLSQMPLFAQMARNRNATVVGQPLFRLPAPIFRRKKHVKRSLKSAEEVFVTPKPYEPLISTANKEPSRRPTLFERYHQMDSGERAEHVSKVLEKVMHGVKIAGHVDGYLANRAKSALKKLHKLFATSEES